MKLPTIKGIKSPIRNTKSVVAPSTERRAAAQKRLNSMKRKQFAKNFLSRYGLDETNVGKTKLFTETLGIFSAQTSRNRSNSVNLPTLDTPTRVSNDNSPTLQTLEKQFQLIANQLKILESITRKQQENFVSQLLAKDEANKESILESGKHGDFEPSSSNLELEPLKDEANKESILESGKHGNFEPGGSNLELEPLNNEIEKLSNSISALIDVLDKKSDDSNGSFLDNLKQRYGIEKPKVSKAEKAARAAKREANMVEKLAANDNNISKLSKAGRLGKAADVIGRGIRSGTQAASRLGGSAAKAIERLAAPIIEKGLGRTVLKSIPVVGAVAGAGFAVGRLLEGDVIGAGLDAASGLGGPLTAIPAFIASTVRDIYSAMYGIQPEEDPNAGARMSEITTVVKGLVSAALGRSIDSRPTPPADSADKGIKGQAATVMKNAGFSAGGGSFGGGGSTGSFDSGGGKSTTSDSGKATTPVSKPGPTKTTSAVQSNPTTPPMTESVSPEQQSKLNADFDKVFQAPARDSTQLIQRSQQNEEMQQPKLIAINDNTNLPSPQRVITKQGKASIGNVPDPTYHLSMSLAKQLYF